MSYIHLFLPDAERKATIKPRVVAIEDDWKFVKGIFPEIGFSSYFLGHIVSKLAKQLKENGITTYHQRSDRPELADISRFLSNIQLVGEAANSDDGRGTGSPRGNVKECKGATTSDAQPVSGQTEEGKDGEEGGPERARVALKDISP